MAARSDVTTQLRLASGLVLMAFVASHLVNHAVALYSLEAVERGREFFLIVWRSWPGSLLLYVALLGHIGLVLHKLYRRRSLKMPAWEAAQIILGLAIPFWLAIHVAGTRGAHQVHGLDDSYAYEFYILWPGGAGRQSLMLILVWLHGCLGLHYWMRLRSWYGPLKPWLFAIALLLPTLSLLGFVDGGRQVHALAEADPAWLTAQAAAGNWPDETTKAWIFQQERLIISVFLVLLLVTLGGRGVRALRARAGGRIRVQYPDGTAVAITPGMSVLEASRSAGIPHAAVCGGRGRCSTCRVRIAQGADQLAPPAADEVKVLERIGAGDGVRLACQLRPTTSLAVVPLLPPTTSPREVRVQVNPGQGVEREIAVLFADLRAFTRMSEGRLPYDVVFVLNQYFKAMGEAIEGEGGRVDKFIGDGIMALFGIEQEPAEACRQALMGARAMAIALDKLNRQLADDLPEPLKMGIGLHAGPVILGQMGYRHATSLTAIGDTVNVASRLEVATKEFGAQLVVSARLAERAGIDLTEFEQREIEIRGRRRPLRVRLVDAADQLPVAAGDDVARATGAAIWAQLVGLGRRVVRTGS